VVCYIETECIVKIKKRHYENHEYIKVRNIFIEIERDKRLCIYNNNVEASLQWAAFENGKDNILTKYFC